MKNQTELMRSILTDETAQMMVDYISPIYGNSYVGIWLLQANGVVMGIVSDIAEKLRAETNPATADLLLDQWEDHYGIARNSALTTQQRQGRIIAKTQSRGPCNPKRLAAAVSSALGGAEVDITENVAKNTFLVNIREVVEDILPAVDVLERMKPAHLIYQIRIATQMVAETELKTAIAMTHAENYRVEVLQ